MPMKNSCWRWFFKKQKFFSTRKKKSEGKEKERSQNRRELFIESWKEKKRKQKKREKSMSSKDRQGTKQRVVPSSSNLSSHRAFVDEDVGEENGRTMKKLSKKNVAIPHVLQPPSSSHIPSSSALFPRRSSKLFQSLLEESIIRRKNSFGGSKSASDPTSIPTTSNYQRRLSSPPPAHHLGENTTTKPSSDGTLSKNTTRLPPLQDNFGPTPRRCGFDEFAVDSLRFDRSTNNKETSQLVVPRLLQRVHSGRIMRTSSMKGESVVVPRGSVTDRRMLLLDNSAAEDARYVHKLNRFQQMVSAVEDRHMRHDPVHVAKKKWVVCIVLCASLQRLFLQGREQVQSHHSKSTGLHVLANLFVPLYRLHRHVRRKNARLVLEDFVLKTARRRRLLKRDGAIKMVRTFFQEKFRFMKGMFRWYVKKIETCQRVVRMYQARRLATCILNALLCRKLEENNVYKQIVAGRRPSHTIAPSQKKSSDAEKSDKKIDANSNNLTINNEKQLRLRRRVPLEVLQVHVRPYLIARAKLCVKNTLRISKEYGDKKFDSRSGGGRHPVNNRTIKMTEENSVKQRKDKMSKEDKEAAAALEESSTNNSLKFRPMMQSLRGGPEYVAGSVPVGKCFLALEECVQVLDEACRTTGVLHNDITWYQHLNN